MANEEIYNFKEKFESEISIRTSLADFEINDGVYKILPHVAGEADKILKE